MLLDSAYFSWAEFFLRAWSESSIQPTAFSNCQQRILSVLAQCELNTNSFCPQPNKYFHINILKCLIIKVSAIQGGLCRVDG